MIVYDKPVRRNTPQNLTNTFRDQDGAIIPLGGYVSVTLLSRRAGDGVIRTSATFLNAPQGQVQLSPYTFTKVGTWDVMFRCLTAGGAELDGEPIQINVVPNADDSPSPLQW